MQLARLNSRLKQQGLSLADTQRPMVKHPAGPMADPRGGQALTSSDAQGTAPLQSLPHIPSRCPSSPLRPALDRSQAPVLDTRPACHTCVIWMRRVAILHDSRTVWQELAFAMYISLPTCRVSPISWEAL